MERVTGRDEVDMTGKTDAHDTWEMEMLLIAELVSE